MWRFIHDFDNGFDLTFEQRFSKENCNDRGEALNYYSANLVKYEMIYYFYLCYLELEQSGQLLESVADNTEGISREVDANPTD